MVTTATITAEPTVASVTNTTMIMSVVKGAIKLCRSSHNVPVICLILNKTEFSTQFSVSNFMNICPVEAKFFHADMWTYMMKLIFDLHYCFVNTPKNAQSGFCLILSCHSCGFMHRNAKCSCDIYSKFYRQRVQQPSSRNCSVSFSGTYSFLFQKYYTLPGNSLRFNYKHRKWQ